MSDITALIEAVKTFPQGPGCYIWKDADGNEMYVGKAKNIRKRVRSYFSRMQNHVPRIQQLIAEADHIEYIELGSEVEALLLENHLIKELQPRYNVRQKDGKDYPLLAITRDEFPRVFITRDKDLKKVDYYGPFTSINELYRAYHFLMRVFQFRNCDLDIKSDDKRRASFRPCLNYHIKLCSGPCTTHINKNDYAADIKSLRAFLSGRATKAVRDQLKKNMELAAEHMRYEDAARYRDQLKALERLKDRGRLRDWSSSHVPDLDCKRALERLSQALKRDKPIKIIEGFDLAHLQGEYVVASMVQFIDAVPNKDGYRRYKIKSNVAEGEAGNNDFAGMAEVVGRRYRRLRDEGQLFPDLILIDGGHGQVHAAVDAIRALEIPLPCIVGLAKKEETLILPNGEELGLGRRHPGLKLLMHVRDEAHRFCRRYYHLLQRKGMHGSDT